MNSDNTYRTCSNLTQTSFFDTPDFLNYTSHLIAIITVPIHIFGFYCVIFKTSVKVKSVKSAMLISCFFAFVLDIFLTILSIPFILAPAAAGFPLGLLNMLNVSIQSQTMMGIFAVEVTFCSIVSLVQNRYCQIARISPKHSKIFKSLTWIVNLSVSFLVCYVSYCLIPNQVSARAYVFIETLPCLPQYIYDSPVFVFTRDSISSTICFGLPVIGIGMELAYFTLGSFYHLYIENDHRLSLHTKMLQRKFFIAVLLQVSVPIIALFFPLAFFGYSLVFEYYNQAFNNSAMLFLCSHGTLETLSMILIHRPYRTTLFCGNKPNKTLFKVKQSPRCSNMSSAPRAKT